jgi:hypothetical protein
LRLFPDKPDCRERTAQQTKAVTVLAFLRKAHAQSGFKERVRRMQCDHKRTILPSRVDLCGPLGNRFRRFPEARFWTARKR